MKLSHLSAISTGTVILIGVVLVAPAFFQVPKAPHATSIMLAFDVLDNNDVTTLSNWCNDLSAFLQAQKLRAAVFVSGKTAEAVPDCTSFPRDVDIGSRTYSYVDLTLVGDYTKALEEVKVGKQVVDRVAHADSKLFRAPEGLTNDNIYSILNRTGITADFSYGDHYNIYENGFYVRHDAETLQGLQVSAQGFGKNTTNPTIIHFDSSTSIEEIGSIVTRLRSGLDSHLFEFVNASGLAGSELTTRSDSQ